MIEKKSNLRASYFKLGKLAVLAKFNAWTSVVFLKSAFVA